MEIFDTSQGESVKTVIWLLDLHLTAIVFYATKKGQNMKNQRKTNRKTKPTSAQKARFIKFQDDRLRKILNSNYTLYEPQAARLSRLFDKSLKPKNMPKDLAARANTIPMKWNVYLYILRRDSNGKNCLECEQIKFNDPIPHEQVRESLGDHHWSLVEEFRASIKADSFITAGWIACGEKMEVSEEDAYKMFDMVGSWSIPSDREAKQLSKG